MLYASNYRTIITVYSARVHAQQFSFTCAGDSGYLSCEAHFNVIRVQVRVHGCLLGAFRGGAVERGVI